MADRLSILTTSINDGVAQLIDYLAKNNLPYPSFEPDAPADLQLSRQVQGAAFAAMDAAQELYDLIRGPRDLPIDHIVRVYFLLPNCCRYLLLRPNSLDRLLHMTQYCDLA